MFTGIIQGQVNSQLVAQKKQDLTIKVPLKSFHDQTINIGDSIALEGVCLTVSKIAGKFLYFQLVNETLKRTTFNNYQNNQKLNYEMSLTLQSKLDGHLVYGEVDCTARIVDIKAEGDSRKYYFQYPKKYSYLIVNKGRVAIDGASLSVIDANQSGFFAIALIPHSYKMLTLANKSINQEVNIEFDIYAKLICKGQNKQNEFKK